MHSIDRLGTGQRVVLVVALGIGLGLLASYLASLGTVTGWYAYAPRSGQVSLPPGRGEPGWLRPLIWLAATGLWATASVRILRPAPGGGAAG
jgi:hypothetical protein